MNNPLPKLTFIIVKKRHNTRFFLQDSNTGAMNNVQPGTVVDTDIVHPEGFDFYLNSHAAIQGKLLVYRKESLKDFFCILRNIKTNFISSFI